MDIVLFILFSLFEYAAILLLLHQLFRIPIREFVTYIFIVSFIESIFSYAVRHWLAIPEITVFLQILMLIYLFKLFWNIQLFYSSVSVTLSYCIYLVIQLASFIVLNILGILNLKQLQHEIVGNLTILGVGLQIVTVLLTLCLAFIIKQKNLGWQYIPDTYKKVNYRNKENQILILIVYASIISFGSFVYIGLATNEYFMFFYLLVLSILSLLMIHMSNARDEIND